jgi:hypothetical protein
LPDALYVLVQQLEDPACHGTERADDDRAAARRKTRRHRQRPYSGAVQERHPGQVQDQPLGPVIDGQGRRSQEPVSLGKAQVTAQDEGTDWSVADGLDRQGMLTHGFSIGSRGLDDTK